MVPGVEVFGTPGWLAALPLVDGTEGEDGFAGGVAGETVGPTADGGGEVCAAAAKVEPARAVAARAAIKKRLCIMVSINGVSMNQPPRGARVPHATNAPRLTAPRAKIRCRKDFTWNL